MQDRKEHVNVIYPEEGKRYRLNVRTAVGRLTVGKVKQCLAAASTCPIPLAHMVLHLNGVPLSNDGDLCESLGIGNGATLSVEASALTPSDNHTSLPPHSVPPQREERRMASTHRRDSSGVMTTAAAAAPQPSAVASSSSSSPPAPRFAMSEQRRLLELQTLEQQDAMLHKDVVVRDDILRSTLHHVDDEMDQASLRRRQLERQRERAEEELRHMQEKEAAAAQERERLARLRTQEETRATERAAELAARREQLRAEQEATRAVSLLKLENEKKRATLAQQTALLAAEKERADLEQDSFEAAEKARELALRSREIDIEHQRLARIREARALEADRRVSLRQRLHYYDRLGIEPPRALQREAAAALLMGREEEEEEEEGVNDAVAAHGGYIERNGARDGMAVKRGEAESYRSTHRTAAALTSSAQNGLEHDASTHRNGLVRSRGASHAPAASPSSPSRVGSQQPQMQQSASSHPDASTVRATSTASTAPVAAVATVPEGGFYDARENAEANLRRLGDDLGLPDGLAFDDSDTCVISIDGEYTLLVTYDAATERLFLYSTLLAALPAIVQDTTAGKLQLYEFLLEASLLGREMCGGGVGASLRNNFVLMSASLYMPTSQPWSLRTLAPQFLHCLQHWRGKLTDFLAALERNSVSPTVHAAGASPAPHTSPGEAATHASWSPQQQQQQPRAVYSVSPSRSHVGSPSQGGTPYGSAASAAGGGVPRVLPVLGLEVTGTVLVNGMPTHYDNGVLVVNAAGPSVLAGIQPNDFVEELNEVPIHSVSDFRRVIAEQLVPGMLVPVRINRGGVAMIVTVRVEAAWSL